MSDKFYLTSDQEDYIKKLLKIDDLSRISIIFEIDGSNVEKGEFLALYESSGRFFKINFCEDGEYGPDCP